MLRGGWDLGDSFNSTPGDLKLPVIHMDNKVAMVNGCNSITQIEFFEYDRVPVTHERITSAYNSYLPSIWTPTVQLKNIPAESSSEEPIDAKDEPQF